MAIYTWNNQQLKFVDRHTGEAMHLPYQGQVCMPSVQSDIPEYRSPIDGKPITSRSHRREDLARNNCVDARDLPRAKGQQDVGKFKNARFAQKYGLPLAEEFK